MSQSKSKTRNDRALNLFIPEELKGSIQEIAAEYDRPLAEIVRFLLRIGIPIVKRLQANETNFLERAAEGFILKKNLAAGVSKNPQASMNSRVLEKD